MNSQAHSQARTRWPRRQLIASAAAAGAAVVISGCGVTKPAAPTATSADSAGIPPSKIAAECGWMSATTPGKGAELVIVPDPTASNFAGLPAAVGNQVKAAAKEKGSVSILTVDGAGSRPQWLLSNAALSDAHAGDARRVRLQAVAANCVSAYARRAVPAKPGTDLLSALQAAAIRVASDRDAGRQAEMIVASDGWSNSGVLDIRQLEPLGADPVAAAGRVPAEELPNLAGTTVQWYGMAEGRESVSQSASIWLADFYRALIARAGGKLNVHRGAVTDGSFSSSPQPDPGVSLPPIDIKPDSVVLPDQLFPVGSAQLSSASDWVLRQYAVRLCASCPNRAQVVGHTSSEGSPQVNQTLSEDRARAVAARLVQLGADASSISASGIGSRQPVIPDIRPDGSFDPVAAKANRRVVITILPG